ncbi:hypothetical protein LCGC14_1863510 [marine sediment metagenome]|uniref:Uncharacterized protein n=1 Tax=marine sediment metagenome TaxID=412755 RepID=A0A0F9GV55_9ZZZZ
MGKHLPLRASGASHTTDWYPGRVSKDYKDNYEEVIWEDLKNGSLTDATMEDCHPGHCGVGCHYCTKV